MCADFPQLKEMFFSISFDCNIYNFLSFKKALILS